MPWIIEKINVDNSTDYKEYTIPSKSRLLGFSLNNSFANCHKAIYLNIGHLGAYSREKTIMAYYQIYRSQIGYPILHYNHDFGKGRLLEDGLFQVSLYSSDDNDFNFSIYYERD